MLGATFGLRYGAVPLQLQSGKSAVEVTKLAELPTTIKLLIAAAEAGEMDTAIATVMAKRGRDDRMVAVQEGSACLIYAGLDAAS